MVAGIHNPGAMGETNAADAGSEKYHSIVMAIGGQKRKIGQGGRRNPLKRPDSGKEIQAFCFDSL